MLGWPGEKSRCCSAAFRVGTNAAGTWFKLERFIPSLLPDPLAPVRGGN
jgi:hypothetical protein